MYAITVQKEIGSMKMTKYHVELAVANGADLSGADLSSADLSRAYLYRANLSRAYLDGAHLYRAKWDDNTVWPEGFTPPTPK